MTKSWIALKVTTFLVSYLPAGREEDGLVIEMSCLIHEHYLANVIFRSQT